MVSSLLPIQPYCCFISGSSKDQPFADRLDADLKQKGVRCWFAPEDPKISKRIRLGFAETIPSPLGIWTPTLRGWRQSPAIPGPVHRSYLRPGWRCY